VVEIRSEHTLEGWLEGDLLTGGQGLFNSYEDFLHPIDSMYVISSLVWRQDHNAFTHQDPGFLDLVSNKSADLTRIYVPPDANCLLSVADHYLRAKTTFTRSFPTSGPTQSMLTEHPYGLLDRDLDSLFTKDKPVIFNFHGYPWLIHKFTYRRTNPANIHVRGHKEQGNINTRLQLAIDNQVDRFDLAADVFESLNCAYSEGLATPEIRNWKWPLAPLGDDLTS
jgi:phosphoketolase